MKRALLWIVVILVIISGFIFLTTPKGYTMPRHTGIRHYHARIVAHGRTRLSTATTSSGHYRVFRTMQIQGGNFVDSNIIRYNLRITWECSDPGLGWGRLISVQTWGDADQYSLWDFEGTTSIVHGHGVNSYGTEYWYRRATGEFSRGLNNFAQHVYPWISFTARADCTFIWDKKVSE